MNTKASRRTTIFFTTALLLSLFALGPSSHELMAMREAPSSLAAASITSIKHIIIMDKENRTFDSMFGRFPGANGATTYVGTDGQVHPLNHQPDKLLGDIKHDPNSAHLAYDNGKMDKFALINGAIQNGVDMADSQLYQSDIPNYWRYAKTFALADNFFSTIMGPSFPNHLFSIAGEDDNVDSNPVKVPQYTHRWGCDAPAGVTAEQRLADGTINQVRPCFNFQTLGDLLTAQGITWKISVPDPPRPL